MAFESGIRGSEARKLLLKSIGTMGLIIGSANIVSAKAQGKSNEQAMEDALRSLNPTAGEFGSVAVNIPGVGSFRAGAAGQLKGSPGLPHGDGGAAGVLHWREAQEHKRSSAQAIGLR